ncbi:MAG: polysaccharide biosynthesis tyrosine autokinase [Parafilimonas sp.]
MMENTPENLTLQRPVSEENNGMDFRKILYIFLRHWVLFLITIIACILLTFMYLRYTTPSYQINSKILIKDDKSSPSGDQADLLSQLDIFNTQNNVDNEKEVLQTHYLISKVVDELHLNISYFAEGSIKSTELYDKCPFKMQMLYLKDSIPTQTFNLNFSDNGQTFTIKSDSINGKYHLNDTIITTNVKFIITSNSSSSLAKNNYFISISTPDATTQRYYNNLTFNINDKSASVILVSLVETVPKKGEDILNKLYEVYTSMNEEDKNKIADSTISFINERLAVVSAELSGVEKDIEQFKVKNQISTDMTEQASLALSNASDIQKQITQQDVQINILESIQNHLKSDEPRIVPNAATILDPTYIATVQQYNILVLERDRQLQTTKADNPLVQNLNNQIEAIKKSLLISLSNIRKEAQITRDELANKNAQFLGLIASGPQKERVFLDISRQENVKQQLYLYLLQKREETAISKSGTLANSRLIEPGKSDVQPFRPNKSLSYLIAFCLGVILPTGGIYLKNLLNNRVTNETDVAKETNVPVIAEIGHNVSDKNIVAEQNSRTALAEQFRALRTNLQFVLKGKEQQVILITSSTSGEGKSFLSVNLGSILAISNKKVVLVELDLRKPKLSKALGMSTDQGFTDYLISKYKKEEIIKQTSVHPNLFLISSGTIPPNPAELLLNNNVDDLFVWLKTQFDYIIVDTPPAGVVIDAVLLGRLANACIYVVRQNFTLKPQLQIINNFNQNEKLPNLSIIINDVQINKSYGYNYGYGYGYGYNSGYYSDDKKQKRKLFKKANKT